MSREITKRAYSVSELAEAWSCSPRHIYNLIKAGELDTFSIGARRGTRIAIEEVERWEKDSPSRSDTQLPALPLEARTEKPLRAGEIRLLVSGGA